MSPFKTPDINQVYSGGLVSDVSSSLALKYQLHLIFHALTAIRHSAQLFRIKEVCLDDSKLACALLAGQVHHCRVKRTLWGATCTLGLDS